MKSIFDSALTSLVLLGVFTFSFFQSTPTYALEKKTVPVPPLLCHTIFSSESDSLPRKYAPPIDFFGGVVQPSILAYCDSRKSVLVELGTGEPTQYIYKYGFTKVDGKWKKVTFTGTNTNGSWIVGKATIRLPGVKVGEKGEILARICTKMNGVWKCGCSDKKCETSKWQLQQYELSNEVYKKAQKFVNDVEKKNSAPKKNVLDLFIASKKLVYSGSTVVLTGSGFSTSSKNEILWNGEVKQTGFSRNGTTLTIVVPNLPPAHYEVKVRALGKETKYALDMWVLTKGQVIKPKISSISPKLGKQGDTFTIQGEGFTKSNDLLTTFGLLKGLPSKDGKSITFTYNPFEKKLEAWEKPGVPYHYEQPISVKVYNTSGDSNAGFFNLEI